MGPYFYYYETNAPLSHYSIKDTYGVSIL